MKIRRIALSASLPPLLLSTPRTGTLHFNEAGILADFEYNQEQCCKLGISGGHQENQNE